MRLNRGALIVTLIAVFFGLITMAPYFTHDSFHYMQLGLKPVLGDSHPPGFGLYLWILKAAGEAIGAPVAGLKLFSFFQLVWLAVVVYFLVPRVGWRSSSPATKTMLAIQAFVLIFAIIPALWMIKNAVWTEMLFLVLALNPAVLLAKFQDGLARGGRRLQMSLLVLCSFVSLYAVYQIRHQGLVLLVAYVLAIFFGFLRGERRLSARVSALAVAVPIALWFAMNALLSAKLPTEAAMGSMLSANLETSMMCALRCDAAVLKEPCANPETRIQVLEPACSEISLHVKPFPWRAGYNSPGAIVKGEGVVSTIRWLVTAPVLYLLEQHKIWGLEIGRFRFADDSAVQVYPDAAAAFREQFDDPNGSMSALVAGLGSYLWSVHFGAWVYNALAGLAVVLSFFVLLKTRRVSTAYLALATIGTLCVFAYVAVHTPFRFLVQLTVLGLFAWSRYLEEEPGGTPPPLS